MTWFKIDDSFWGHPKRLACSSAGIGVWVTAGSWCAQQLTDGHVPKHVLPVLGGRPRDAADLVRVGLWETVDDGWVFHDWAEYQPSREDVLAQRASNAARQSVARNPDLRGAVRSRDGDRCRYCSVQVRWNDRRGPHGGTYDHVIPDGPSSLVNLVVACRGCNAAKGRRTPEQAGMRLTSDSHLDLGPTQVDESGRTKAVRDPRPDPTRPDLEEKGTTSPSSAAAAPDTTPTRKTGTRIDPHLDDDGQYPVTDDMKTWAATNCPLVTHPGRETENFADYWSARTGKDATKLDWGKTWKTWMRNAQARAERGAPLAPVRHLRPGAVQR